MTKLRLIVYVLAAGWSALCSAEDGRVPLPTIATGAGEQCVEPVPDIRRNHMRYLRHQRDDTVHSGIRDKRHSLVGCIECHALRDESGQFVPVNAPDQFCASCHRYAAVKIDCFQCHATTPGEATMSTGDARE